MPGILFIRVRDATVLTAGIGREGERERRVGRVDVRLEKLRAARRDTLEDAHADRQCDDRAG
eukprot:5374206-Prymnesium_polylepis.1